MAQDIKDIEKGEDTSQTPDEGTRPDEQPGDNAPSDETGSDEQSQTESAEAQETDETGKDEVDLDNVQDPSNLSPEDRAEYYKRKFGHSTRENQRLMNALKETKDKFTTEDIPTDEELSEKYPNFSDMADHEKDMLRRSVASERKVNRLAETVDSVVASNARISEAEEAIRSHSELSGSEDEFIDFATKEGNRNTDMDTLVSAFLYKKQGESSGESKSSEKPALNTSSPKRGSSKGASPEAMTAQEAKDLRENNFKEYQRRIKAGTLVIEE